MTQRLLARGRSDDTPPIIARRMEGFRAQTLPVLQMVKEKLSVRLQQQQQQQQQTEQQQQQQQMLRDGSSQPDATQSQLQAKPTSPPAYTAAHGYYVVDGRPSIEEVYRVVKPIFLQFLQRH